MVNDKEESGSRLAPIAYFRSPFTSKFGIPRQSGVVEDVVGYIEFLPPFSRPEAIRGIEDFEYLWLIWGFSANKSLESRVESLESRVESSESRVERRESRGESLEKSHVSLTVRPPRLGGNERIGVFASRSPFRPNGLGLSCVKLSRVISSPHEGGQEVGSLEVLGADLMDGTPIYDIKPYIAYTDAHPDARCGFVDKTEWKPLEVKVSVSAERPFKEVFTPQEQSSVIAALSQDPRPHYHKDSGRIYGMPFAGHDIRFTVNDGVVTIEEIKPLPGPPLQGGGWSKV